MLQRAGLRAVRACGRVLNSAAPLRPRPWDERGLTTGRRRVRFVLLHDGPRSASAIAARLIADRLVRRNFSAAPGEAT